MNEQSVKENIKSDFSDKSKIYFDKNYNPKKSKNFIRQKRNEIIKEIIREKAINYDSILDVGSGPEILYQDLYENCLSYSALDLSIDNLNNIRDKYSNEKLKLIESDLDSYAPIDNKYDIIVCSGSIEYTFKPIDNIVKLTKALKKHGILIISLPNKTSISRIWDEYFFYPIMRIIKIITGKKVLHYKRRLFTFNEIFKVVSQEHLMINKIYFGTKVVLQPFDQLMKKLDYLTNQYLENSIQIKFLSTEFIIVITNNKRIL